MSGFSRCIRRGAMFGAGAWLAYGAAEHTLAAIAPRVVNPDAGFRMLHQGFSAGLLILYAGAGLVLGALAGAALRVGRAGSGSAPSDSRLAAAALATVALVFAANLVRELASAPSVLPAGLLGLASLVALALLAASASEAASRRLRFVAHPAVVALLLVVPPWITKGLLRHGPLAQRAVSALALCLVVLAASAVARRFARPLRPGRTLAVAATAAGIAFAVGLRLNRVPGPPRFSGAPPTHVVLVVLDTVRSDHLSLYGYERPTTPHLERFAAEATVYTRAVASGDMTLSTHASLFTGLYAREHGAHHPDPRLDGPGPPAALDERFETLAERLSREDFLTAGVTANHGYLNPFFRLNQGFAYWDSRIRAGRTWVTYTLRRAVWRLLRGAPVSAEDRHRDYRSADAINDEVFALLERVEVSRTPICLFVNYMDAHFPYVPPPPFDGMFPGRSAGLSVPLLERRRVDVLLRGASLSEEERLHLLSQYDGGIAYVDSRFGMLIERLKRKGIHDDALIVVLSDHGEAFGERGLVDHGVSVYEDQVAVPLLVKYPRRSAPGRVDVPVSTVDVLPTVLDGLGLEIPEGMRGRSLLRVAEAADPRPVIAEHYPFAQLVQERSDAAVRRALYGGRLKLIRSGRGGGELYDLAADPHELRDLAPGGGASAELDARLDRWLQETPAAETAADSLDAEAREALEALGYTT